MLCQTKWPRVSEGPNRLEGVPSDRGIYQTRGFLVIIVGWTTYVWLVFKENSEWKHAVSRNYTLDADSQKGKSVNWLVLCFCSFPETHHLQKGRNGSGQTSRRVSLPVFAPSELAGGPQPRSPRVRQEGHGGQEGDRGPEMGRDVWNPQNLGET